MALKFSALALPERWMPDDISDGCTLCGDVFGMLTWRHHCRSCGGLVCGSCAPFRCCIIGEPETHEAGAAISDDPFGLLQQQLRICRTCATIAQCRNKRVSASPPASVENHSIRSCRSSATTQTLVPIVRLASDAHNTVIEAEEGEASPTTSTARSISSEAETSHAAKQPRMPRRSSARTLLGSCLNCKNQFRVECSPFPQHCSKDCHAMYMYSETCRAEATASEAAAKVEQPVGYKKNRRHATGIAR